MTSTRSGRAVVRPTKFAILGEEEAITGDVMESTTTQMIMPTTNDSEIKEDQEFINEFIDLQTSKTEDDMIYKDPYIQFEDSDGVTLYSRRVAEQRLDEYQTPLLPSEPVGGNFPQWWVRLSTTFHSYLSSEYLVDLWILCDDGHMVPAHQVILAHASPTLKAWFGDTRWQTQEENVTVSLPDASHGLVTQFVTAVYLGKLPDGRDDQMKVCELAERLGVYVGGSKTGVVRLRMIDSILGDEREVIGRNCDKLNEGKVKTVERIQVSGISLKSDPDRKSGISSNGIRHATADPMESLCEEMMAEVAMEGFVGHEVGVENSDFPDKVSEISEGNDESPESSIEYQPLREFQDMEKDILKTKAYKMQQIKMQQERSCSACKKSAISHRYDIKDIESKLFLYRCCLADCGYDKLKTARAFNGHMAKHKRIPEGKNEAMKKVCPLCNKPRIKHKNVNITHWPNGMKLKGNLYKCCHCAASKLNSKKFFIHTENHVAKKFVCDVCQKGYSYKHLLQEHVWKEHGEGQHIRFQCSWTGCEYSAKYKQTLYAHVMEKHHGITKKHPLRRPKDAHGEPISSNVECPTCKKSLGRRYYEKVHKPTCAGAEVIYQCEICGKEGFINSVTLQNHVRSKHSADRPYQCEYCPAKFATSESLSHHRSSRHGVNAKGDVVPKKMYPCNRCGKLLTSRLKLMKHIEVLHEGKRDFRCKYCEKSFGSKSNLQIHEGSIHTGILPYKCEYCSKMFSRRQLLTNHRDTIHPGHEGPIYIVEDVNCVQVDEMIVPVQTIDGGVGFTVGMDGVVQGVSMA